MKGCLDRGPLRPTSPIQAADKERSGDADRRAEVTGPPTWLLPLFECESQPPTLLCFHVEADAQVAAGVEEPVVGGRGDVKRQPTLLTCRH